MIGIKRFIEEDENTFDCEECLMFTVNDFIKKNNISREDILEIRTSCDLIQLRNIYRMQLVLTYWVN